MLEDCQMFHTVGLCGMLEDCTSWDSVSSLSISVRSTVSTTGNTVPVADKAAEFPLSRVFNIGSVEDLDRPK